MSKPPLSHSGAWIAQSWISFVASAGVTSIGIYLLPVDGWMRGFLAMGLLFTIGSCTSLAKTLRDQHEGQQLLARVDEARVAKLVAEHHPL